LWDEGMKRVYMSDKTINYIGMGLGILVTIFIVTLGCYDKFSNCDDIFFTTDAQYTMLYDWFGSTWTSGHGSSGLSIEKLDILRIFILGIGFWLSYKFREKIGNTILKFHKSV